MSGFHNKKGKQMSYDINVVCNGNRCKQYLHNGRTYIEAKEGSEYVVEIKNNTWEKILAVVSVDGLNVVDGKAADENGPGYVMDKYTAQKLYGWQYSQEKVATFKFGAFGAKDSQGNPLGYAASKGDGSEKNAGIIGVRIWDEVPKPPQPPLPTYEWQTCAISCSWASSSYPMTTGIPGMPNIIRGGLTYSSNPHDWTDPNPGSGLYGPGRFGYSTGQVVSNASPDVSVNTIDYSKGNLLTEALADAKAIRQTALANAKNAMEEAFDPNFQVTFCSALSSDKAKTDEASFDMETQWGESRNYKVKETTFERKEIVHRFDIYYASRESLLAMGVDLGTEKRVSFPESFKEDKYAKPPKGWSDRR